MDNVRRLRHVNFTRINSAALAALPTILGGFCPAVASTVTNTSSGTRHAQIVI